ncbi:coiled-coil domain-containing protein 43 [Sitodiplosis mosellana]|uniref:coiled-coil domain-containing protein 43 n=1 Tax=Sitodiplosis mosellana TaxID=263140 RepID=UPI0024452337|nr:coiled-coil domain-containing protein 43 [Sitodiplosis mosellana]
MSDKEAFNKWLNNKLKSLNTDETVFGSYILGILEGDESKDEKREALEGILSAIIEDDLENVIKEITDEWEKCEPKSEAVATESEDVDAKLARLLENKHITTTVQRTYTEEEKKIREQILAQYSQVEYDDGYDEENEEAAGASGGGAQDGSDPLMVKNTNAADVQALAKERREQAKIDSKAKKDKDKSDREKQKQLREEKKEKRKTVKGERRR